MMKITGLTPCSVYLCGLQKKKIQLTVYLILLSTRTPKSYRKRLKHLRDLEENSVLNYMYIMMWSFFS